MARKNALAGLWWGGGKGVIWRENDHPFQDRQFRNTLFQSYGCLVRFLFFVCVFFFSIHASKTTITQNNKNKNKNKTGDF